MAWQTQTKEDRQARRSRREKRRRRVQTLETRLWEDKEQAARSDRDKAAVEYDYTRARIEKEPDPARRAAMYRELHEALTRFNVDHGWRMK